MAITGESLIKRLFVIGGPTREQPEEETIPNDLKTYYGASGSMTAN
jgi:hypothetical protein